MRIKFPLLLLFTLLTVLSTAVEKKNVRVYVDVVGDLFHSGHIEFFKKARAEGDSLIVGVLSDETVENYKRRPILTMNERIALISACRFVDEVIADCPLRVTEKWIKDHRIDLIIHGDDFDATKASDHYSVPIKMGIFKTVPYTQGVSTSNIIERIKSRDALDLAKKAG